MYILPVRIYIRRDEKQDKGGVREQKNYSHLLNLY